MSITARLVGIMSLVLLLSLGAFAVLMHRHHGMVMDELAHTVADVGRETLRTFQFVLPQGAAAGPAAAGATVDVKERVWTGEGRAGVHRVLVVRKDLVADAPGPHCDAIAGVDAAGSPVACELDVEDVRVESDPDAGLLLRIPHGTGGKPVEAMAFTSSFTSGEKDFVLPVPTSEYRQLLSSTWRTTLVAFGSVFVVAVALSASFAARFTRPIRRLDAAIHRLSAGDLDVEVEAKGRDEVGRLARAFNEMAAHLRAARERERELKRREKLSALGRLAAGVAHDVRNPLHAIGLTLENLREAGRPEDPVRAAEHDRSVRIIREEIGRLDALVESFLRFAKSDRSTLEVVDVRTMLASIEELLAGEARRRGIDIVRTVEEPLPLLRGNAESLRSSILNLALNSFEAMPRGGTVRLSAAPSAEGLVVTVTDSGCGIPADEQERIFEFAYTTREGGSGLGLAMVHHVVTEEHGGRVVLSSSPGAGTQVRLELPAGREAAHAA